MRIDRVRLFPILTPRDTGVTNQHILVRVDSADGGTGWGEFIERDAVTFLGGELKRVVLVCQGLDQAVWYRSTEGGDIQRGEVEFSFILGRLGTCADGIGLSPAEQSHHQHDYRLLQLRHPRSHRREYQLTSSARTGALRRIMAPWRRRRGRPSSPNRRLDSWPAPGRALHGLLKRVRDWGDTRGLSQSRGAHAGRKFGPEHSGRKPMKAVVYSRYGSPDVLQLTEVAKPVPTDDEVLIKLAAVSVNRSDWELLIGKPLCGRR